MTDTIPNKITVQIVEDEAIVALDLSQSLLQQGYAVAGISKDAADAEKVFYTKHPDILLIDINIDGAVDGISLVEKLTRSREIPVIYLTALSDLETLKRVKATKPAAYLTKPYTMRNVAVAIELAFSNLAVLKSGEEQNSPVPKTSVNTDSAQGKEIIMQQDDYIFIKHNYRFVKVPLKEILYVEADNNYIHIVTATQKYLLRLSLQHLEAKISYDKFLRIHRSFIINITAIDSFSEAEVKIGARQLPVGRAYKDAFVSRFHFR